MGLATMGRDRACDNRFSHRKRPKSHDTPNETAATTRQETVSSSSRWLTQLASVMSGDGLQVKLTLFGVEVDLDGGVTPGVEDLRELTIRNTRQSNQFDTTISLSNFKDDVDRTFVIVSAVESSENVKGYAPDERKPW